MVIRWMGAYGGGHDFLASLRWELSGSAGHLVCATTQLEMPSKVGLIVKNRSIVRRFKSDVYSGPRGKRQRLVMGRQEATGWHHDELWCHQDYAAIIIRGIISRSALDAVKAASREFNIPIKFMKEVRNDR